MKKLILILATATSIVSCGKSDEVKPATPTTPTFCYECYTQIETKSGGGASSVVSRKDYDICGMTEAQAYAWVNKYSVPWHWEGYFQYVTVAKCNKKQ